MSRSYNNDKGVMGVSPTSFSQMTSKRPLVSYPPDIFKNIQILTAHKGDKVIPFGSLTYRAQKYPGDIDLREDFIDCCHPDEVVTKFAKYLRALVKKITARKNHYVTEIKAGIDERYDIDIGSCQNGVYQPNKEVLISITNLYYTIGLLNDEEKNDIMDILGKKGTLGGDEYDLMKFVWRERKILRWTSDEIIQGHKILPLNEKIYLHESLLAKSDVKIDTISLIKERYVEVTNYFTLGYFGTDGMPIAVNFKDNVLDKEISYKKYETQMKTEIEKLYYSNMYFSPFKMVKRIWAFSRSFKDNDSIIHLQHLIGGDLSLGYSLTSELSAILSVVKHKHRIYKSMYHSLDQIKWKLNGVSYIDDQILTQLLKLIDNTKKVKSYKSFLKKIDHIEHFIKKIVNENTIFELNKISWNPPPNRFLPQTLTYDPKIKRT